MQTRSVVLWSWVNQQELCRPAGGGRYQRCVWLGVECDRGHNFNAGNRQGNFAAVGQLQKIVYVCNRASCECNWRLIRLPCQTAHDEFAPGFVTVVIATRLFPLAGGQRHHPQVDRWFDSQPIELGSLARRWFEEMRQSGSDVVDLLHDGHPTACVGELAFGYVNSFRRHVNVGFFLGTSLADPSCLLEGTGRFMRHVKIDPSQPIDEFALSNLILCAYTDMKARVVSS